MGKIVLIMMFGACCFGLREGLACLHPSRISVLSMFVVVHLSRAEGCELMKFSFDNLKPLSLQTRITCPEPIHACGTIGLPVLVVSRGRRVESAALSLVWRRPSCCHVSFAQRVGRRVWVQ